MQHTVARFIVNEAIISNLISTKLPHHIFSLTRPQIGNSGLKECSEFPHLLL